MSNFFSFLGLKRSEPETPPPFTLQSPGTPSSPYSGSGGGHSSSNRTGFGSQSAHSTATTNAHSSQINNNNNNNNNNDNVSQYDTGVLGCLEDFPSCLHTIVCCPCAVSLTRGMLDTRPLSATDLVSCFPCFSAYHVRRSVREKFNIRSLTVAPEGHPRWSRCLRFHPTCDGGARGGRMLDEIAAEADTGSNGWVSDAADAAEFCVLGTPVGALCLPCAMCLVCQDMRQVKDHCERVGYTWERAGTVMNVAPRARRMIGMT